MLRQKIVSLLSTKGVRATTGQIQILTETNQALDFVVMLLLKPRAIPSSWRNRCRRTLTARWSWPAHAL